MAISEARKNYRMPRVPTMTPVLVSRNARFTNPLQGFVVACYDDSIDVIAFNSQSLRLEIAFFNCPHISDPLITEKPKLITEHRDQCGVWDFSDQMRTAAEARNRLTQLEEEVRELQGKITSLQTIKASDRKK